MRVSLGSRAMRRAKPPRRLQRIHRGIRPGRCEAPPLQGPPARLMGLLDGKVVIITGAGGGIGRAHALLFAERGRQDRRQRPRRRARRHRRRARAPAEQGRRRDPRRRRARRSPTTTTSRPPRAPRRIVKAAVDAFGRVDVLVNNAGILRDKSFLKMDEAMWDAVVAVHLKGTFLCSQVFAKQMVAQGGGGRIVNTTSVSGMLGNFGQANYSAAKAGIYGLTRTMSIELQKHRITVNAIAPIAKTRMTEDLPMFQGVDTLTARAHRAGRALSRERPVRRPHGPRARHRGRARVRVQGRRDARAASRKRTTACGRRRRSPRAGTRSSRFDAP